MWMWKWCVEGVRKDGSGRRRQPRPQGPTPTLLPSPPSTHASTWALPTPPPVPSLRPKSRVANSSFRGPRTLPHFTPWQRRSQPAGAPLGAPQKMYIWVNTGAQSVSSSVRPWHSPCLGFCSEGPFHLSLSLPQVSLCLGYQTPLPPCMGNIGPWLVHVWIWGVAGGCCWGGAAIDGRGSGGLLFAFWGSLPSAPPQLLPPRPPSPKLPIWLPPKKGGHIHAAQSSLSRHVIASIGKSKERGDILQTEQVLAPPAPALEVEEKENSGRPAHIRLLLG